MVLLGMDTVRLWLLVGDPKYSISISNFEQSGRLFLIYERTGTYFRLIAGGAKFDGPDYFFSATT